MNPPAFSVQSPVVLGTTWTNNQRCVFKRLLVQRRLSLRQIRHEKHCEHVFLPSNHIISAEYRPKHVRIWSAAGIERRCQHVCSLIESNRKGSMGRHTDKGSPTVSRNPP